MSQGSEFKHAGVLRGERSVDTVDDTKEQAMMLDGRPRQILVLSRDGTVGDHQSLGRPCLATKGRESQLCC